MSARVGDTADAADGVHDVISLARLALSDDVRERVVSACRRLAAAWQDLPETRRGADPSVVSNADCAPSHPAGLTDVLRDDVPAPGLSSDAALAGAPAVDGNAFVVARVADIPVPGRNSTRP